MGPIKKRKIILLLVVILLLTLLFWNADAVRRNREAVYDIAMGEFSDGDYQDAIDTLSPISEFKDSQKHILYSRAMILFANKEYEEAGELFSQLSGFLDSDYYKAQCVVLQENIEKLQENNQAAYTVAIDSFHQQKYVEALAVFEELGEFEDSTEMAEICKNQIRMRSYSNTISAGIRYSAAVSTGETAYFSGEGFEGESDMGTWTDIVSICAKGHIVIGLKSDGTVVTAGNIDKYRIDTSMWRDIVAVEAGQQYVVGLRADGTLTAQGHNGDGQTDIDGDEWHNIVSIACGWRHTVGLDANGKIHITGYDSANQLAQIERNQSEWTDIVAISAGGGSNESGKRGHTVALRRDGTAVAVGDNSHGQCNVYGEEWTNLVAISAGDDHTVGLRADGTVVTTQTPQKPSDLGATIADWKNVVAISAGYEFTLALVEDSTNGRSIQYTVVGDGNENDGQRNTGSWSSVAIYSDEWELKFDKDFAQKYFTMDK